MGIIIIRPAKVIATAALAGLAIYAPVHAQFISSDVLRKARTSCLTAVAKTVGIPRSNLQVIDQASVVSGISTDVKVPKATAPWGCFTDRQGKVKDVHFKGSEGAL